jgi:hypothetical protein
LACGNNSDWDDRGLFDDVDDLLRTRRNNHCMDSELEEAIIILLRLRAQRRCIRRCLEM